MCIAKHSPVGGIQARRLYALSRLLEQNIRKNNCPQSPPTKQRLQSMTSRTALVGPSPMAFRPTGATEAPLTPNPWHNQNRPSPDWLQPIRKWARYFGSVNWNTYIYSTVLMECRFFWLKHREWLTGDRSKILPIGHSHDPVCCEENQINLMVPSLLLKN